jgi:hypothetical protein
MSSLDAVEAPEQELEHTEEITVSRDSLPGDFIIDACAKEAQAPIVSKRNAIISITALSFVFSSIAVCLPEIFSGRPVKS